MNNRKQGILRHIVLMLMGMLTLAPFVVLLVNSLRKDIDIKMNPFALPEQLVFSNYTDAWRIGDYARGYMNSFIVFLMVTVVVCMIGGLFAFAVTKIKIPGSEALIVYFLVAMAIPTQMYLVPLFYSFQKVGLVNNLFGLSLIYIATYLPFSIMLLRSFFISIPKDLDEASMVDGCNPLLTFIHITLPLAQPAFVTVMLIVGLWTWNEFMFSNIFLNLSQMKTVATRYVAFTSEHDTNIAYISAGGVISVLPIILIYLVSQKKFIEGMTAGSVKG